MAITIPNYEMEICEKLMMLAWAAAVLQNDIFSWPKECDAAKINSRKQIVNVVSVLMGEHSIDGHQAMEKLRIITKGYVSDYLAIVAQEIGSEELFTDLRVHLEAMLWCLSGNAVWSITCPRYNSGESFNDSQLALMDWRVRE